MGAGNLESGQKMTRIKLAVLALFFTIGSALGLSPNRNGDTLHCVSLEGFRNSQYTQWCTGLRKGNGHAVVFYNTPRDKQVVENAADCMNNQTNKGSEPTVYYVVNKKSANVPTMILQHMLKNRSKKYPDITYCIDNEEQLPAAWKLDPRHAHIVVLDENAVVMFCAILPLKQSECAELRDILTTVP
jgi:hypothetical protein